MRFFITGVIYEKGAEFCGVHAFSGSGLDRVIAGGQFFAEGIINDRF